VDLDEPLDAALALVGGQQRHPGAEGDLRPLGRDVEVLVQPQRPRELPVRGVRVARHPQDRRPFGDPLPSRRRRARR
jgi:hypothetical protein